MENTLASWKNVIIVSVFMLATPLTIFTSIFTLNILSDKTEAAPAFKQVPVVGVYASKEISTPSINASVVGEDARYEIIRQYLEFYGSALEPYAKTLVDASDYYDLDYRLLTAIAQQESNLCKWIPQGSYNCWGWGIHSAGTLGFSSYDEAIWTVAKGLRENYLDLGYQTPDEIMSKYTPLSKGSWAAGVSEFMGDLK